MTKKWLACRFVGTIGQDVMWTIETLLVKLFRLKELPRDDQLRHLLFSFVWTFLFCSCVVLQGLFVYEFVNTMLSDGNWLNLPRILAWTMDTLFVILLLFTAFCYCLRPARMLWIVTYPSIIFLALMLLAVHFSHEGGVFGHFTLGALPLCLLIALKFTKSPLFHVIMCVFVFFSLFVCYVVEFIRTDRDYVVEVEIKQEFELNITLYYWFTFVPAFLFVYTMSRENQYRRSQENLLFEIATGIADLDLNLPKLKDLKEKKECRCSQIEKALKTIISNVENYKSYLPEVLFSPSNGSDGDDDDEEEEEEFRFESFNDLHGITDKTHEVGQKSPSQKEKEYVAQKNIGQGSKIHPCTPEKRIGSTNKINGLSPISSNTSSSHSTNLSSLTSGESDEIGSYDSQGKIRKQVRKKVQKNKKRKTPKRRRNKAISFRNSVSFVPALKNMNSRLCLKERKLTLLFVKIVELETTKSENFLPVHTIIMNHVAEVMKIHRGTIDFVLGNLIICSFNSSVRNVQHSRKALYASCELKQRFEERLFPSAQQTTTKNDKKDVKKNENKSPSKKKNKEKGKNNKLSKGNQPKQKSSSGTAAEKEIMKDVKKMNVMSLVLRGTFLVGNIGTNSALLKKNKKKGADGGERKKKKEREIRRFSYFGRQLDVAFSFLGYARDNIFFYQENSEEEDKNTKGKEKSQEKGIVTKNNVKKDTNNNNKVIDEEEVVRILNCESDSEKLNDEKDQKGKNKKKIGGKNGKQQNFQYLNCCVGFQLQSACKYIPNLRCDVIDCVKRRKRGEKDGERREEPDGYEILNVCRLALKGKCVDTSASEGVEWLYSENVKEMLSGKKETTFDVSGELTKMWNLYRQNEFDQVLELASDKKVVEAIEKDEFLRRMVKKLEGRCQKKMNIETIL